MTRVRGIFVMGAAAAMTAGGLLAAAPSASAKERQVVVVGKANDVITRHVSYVDLNLATRAGQKMLNDRVALAVSSVCEESTGAFPEPHAIVPCRSYAWSGARPQMKLAVLRAQQLATTGFSTIAASGITIAARN